MNAWRLLFAGWYFVAENNYFGWNQLPASPEELIADGIFLVLLSLAFEKDRQP